ncbi:hypothetical protein EHI8A_124440 [Entamoeba histolytica HM-1:IMSS-B]|uniref:Uncharacterized protein n=6 Tax=Entamoeba histolytica TaxID=5759 RepID=C4MAP2_ENTH1|nr:hypothetical protein EHI_162560 [Entamoeba histolytica HM-1:IMSS]EMD44790.1 Hypothetical protein EHI5A_162410 [Entamoeba histolytica KU27]EMH72782.1 hypothetical protein EHI8A_124440 [Entamoeba histolytica HM-1:IMSS-B]EMS16122.1 hypothetical protein KM1_146570 [Entamoeba histolytica HM-3:IMSS]ENY64437.1 hypothetical protein EHI7A_116990 [Entamoeba histolytica HM-1:IMSS-A]GAT98895.1 hypothetical protein CL6EHI_162560 [Entamoeba histolytica]|eukprot:XP_651746.1 hypothetical protein EHI_162560 [Entamoeba histolytica HM-1:IMSS]
MLFFLLLSFAFSQQFLCDSSETIDIDIIDSVRTITLDVLNNKNQPMSFPGCGDSMTDHAVWYRITNKVTQPIQVTLRTLQTIPPTTIFLRISSSCPSGPSVNSCLHKTMLTQTKDTFSFILQPQKTNYIALVVNGLSKYSTQIQITTNTINRNSKKIQTTLRPGSSCPNARSIPMPFSGSIEPQTLFHSGNGFEYWIRFITSHPGEYVINTCSSHQHNIELQFFSTCGKLISSIVKTKCVTGFGFVYTFQLPIGQTMVQILSHQRTQIPFSLKMKSNDKLLHSDIRNAKSISIPFKENIEFEQCHHSSDHCNINAIQTSAIYYNVIVPIGDKVVVKTCNPKTTVNTKISIFENLYYNSKCLVQQTIHQPCNFSSIVEWKNIEQEQKKIVIRVGEEFRDSKGEAEIYIDVVPAGITAIESKMIEDRTIPHWAPDSVSTKQEWINRLKNKKKVIPKKTHKQFIHPIKNKTPHPSSVTPPSLPQSINQTQHLQQPQQSNIHPIETNKNTNNYSNSKRALIVIFVVLVLLACVVVGFVYFRRNKQESQYFDLMS